MVKGITSAGFEFELDRSRLDDMRYIDLLAVIVSDEVSEGERTVAISKSAEFILGKEQKTRLYEFIGAQHEGRVPILEFNNQLTEIVSHSGKDAEKN